MKWVKQTIRYWCPDTRSRKALGQNITVAVLDTGIAPHPDLTGRILAFRDFTGTSGQVQFFDDSGHGTHVAGILAGNGSLSSGTYAGIAPLSNLLIGKVLDQNGNGNVQNILNGIQWLQTVRENFSLRIVNISVGTRPDIPVQQKLLLLDAVESLWDLGLVVVVSAGNHGPTPGSVAVPGNSPKVITVGVPDSALAIHTSSHSLNYSGRGPTEDCVVKPDLFAPGTGILSCNAFYRTPPPIPIRRSPPYISKTGTSMATPMVSGAIACLLSKSPELTNTEVKLKLRDSSRQIPGTETGWGLLDISKLLS